MKPPRPSAACLLRARPLRRLGILLAVFVTVSAAPLALRAASPGDRPHVLVVHSYHDGMPWTAGVSAGLREKVGAAAELVAVHLDVKRFPAPAREAFHLAAIAEAIAEARPEAIVTVDDYAYDFVLRHRAKLGPDLPMIFGGVNYWNGRRPPGVSGVREAFDLAATLQLALSLHREARRVVVVNDASETGRANRIALDHAGLDLGGRSLLHVGTGTFAETEALLATLDARRDVVLLLSWNLDSTGATRSYELAVARAHALSNAPIYGVWDFLFGHGIVGGHLLDGHTHGAEIGGLVCAVLDGVPVDTLPVVEKCRTRLLLDARELERFRVPASRLPAGAEIRFRPPSVLRENAPAIAGIALIIVLQGVTIAGLFASRLRRQRAERSQLCTEHDLQLTLHSINDAVLSTDAAGRITRMNPVAEELSGWTLAEARNRAVPEVLALTKRDREEPLGDLTQPVRTRGESIRHAQARLTHRQGNRRHIAYSLAPIRDADGTITGAVTVFRDISDTLRLEEQLRQAQKMESIGLLAGGVAHDFNNVLQVIYGSLQFARDPGSTPAERAEALGEIARAAERATALTRQLLAFGRRQKLTPRDVDLAAQVDDTLKMVRRLIGVDIVVSFPAPRETYWARVDPGQIEQVVLNLCLNARDAMPGGGRLTLDLTHKTFTEDDAAATPWVQAGHFVCLSVTDTGTGIDPDTCRRIFEPFFSTKPAGQGTGLGLSVVQGIVQQHEGLINVYSEVGIGTTFRVYLPALAAAGRRPATQPPFVPLARPTTQRPLTVLLAEDEPATRSTTRRILRQQGFNVLTVSDGEEACTVAAAHHGPIDVAVLDVVMPRLGGPEAARRLLALRPGLPIVLCSGHPGAIPHQTEIDLAWRWLTKPYPAAELIRAILASQAERPDRPDGTAAPAGAPGPQPGSCN